VKASEQKTKANVTQTAFPYDFIVLLVKISSSIAKNLSYRTRNAVSVALRLLDAEYLLYKTSLVQISQFISTSRSRFRSIGLSIGSEVRQVFKYASSFWHSGVHLNSLSFTPTQPISVFIGLHEIRFSCKVFSASSNCRIWSFHSLLYIKMSST